MTRAEAEKRDPGSIRLCDCAEYTRPILGESEAGWRAMLPYHRQKGQPPVAVRRLGRPYCPSCAEAFDYLQRAAASDGRLRAFAGNLLTAEGGA
jgi:hypothetical protein